MLDHVFLLTVEVHSKWLEIIQVGSTTLAKMTEVRQLFSVFGSPEQSARCTIGVETNGGAGNVCTILVLACMAR